RQRPQPQPQRRGRGGHPHDRAGLPLRPEGLLRAELGRCPPRGHPPRRPPPVVSAGDAAVYVKLCVAGPWKVSDLAEALEVHRNDVYRSLERLGARGLVETTLESPARYTAADPLKVLDLEIEARLAALEALKSSRQRTTDLVKALQCDAQGPQKTVYRILQGRQEISAARRKLIAGARHEVLALTTSPHAIAI